MIDRWSLLRGGRIYVWLGLVSLALGAVSLTYPSTPSYDPWSWLVWGREILHGQLVIAGGSSWKPLPVLFTTPFALFGSAQPNLWLLVARAGAAMAVLMSAKLAIRIVWQLTLGVLEGVGGAVGGTGASDGAGAFAAMRPSARAATLLPCALAGLIALVGVGYAGGFPVMMMLGYSDAFAMAILLVAAERAWDGHHRQAFALMLLTALDRPEIWIVWGPYGLWLIWRQRRAWPLVTGLGILMLALWLVPERLGGGTAKALVTHAQHNHSIHSAVYASFPLWHELNFVLWPLALERVEIAALAEIALTAWLVLRARRRLGSWGAAAGRYRPAVAAALAGASGLLWWVMISVETQAGFAGNPRYAVLGTMLIYVGGGAAYGWACLVLARLIAHAPGRYRGASGGAGERGDAGRSPSGDTGRYLDGERGRPSWGPLTLVATLVMALVFVFVPNMFSHRMPSIASLRYSLRFQAQLRGQTEALIAMAGRERLLNCGYGIMTNNLNVTMVAWELDVPINWVQSTPKLPPPPQKPPTAGGPHVIFQDADNATDPLKPAASQIQAWEQGGLRYKVTDASPVTLYTDCPAPHAATRQGPT